MDSTDVLADLPAPFDGEPESVRKDIADELADHLACAYRRELLLTADDQTARRNVLHKFGDPRRIARQLWFQALWGRIMLAKLKLAVPWFKFAAVAVFAWSWLMVMEQVTIMRTYSVTMAQQSASLQNQAMHQQALLQQVLQRLPAVVPMPDASADPMGGDSGMAMPPGGGPAVMYNPAEMINPADDKIPPGGFLLRLVDDRQPAQPASGCLVALAREDGIRVAQLASNHVMDMAGGIGAPMMPMMAGAAAPAARSAPMKQYAPGGVAVAPADQGRVRFPKVEPGRYRLFIEFPDGRMLDHRLVIPPGASAEARQLTIVCPNGETESPAYVVFESPPIVQVVTNRSMYGEVTLIPDASSVNPMSWRNSNDSGRLTLRFDPVTGAVNQYTRWKPDFSTNLSAFQRQGESSLPAVYLGDAKPEERFIAVPSGRYQAWISYNFSDAAIGFGHNPAILTIRANGDADEVITITPETKTVKFDNPPGWQDKLLKELGIKPDVPATDAVSRGVSATNGQETKPAAPAEPEKKDPK